MPNFPAIATATVAKSSHFLLNFQGTNLIAKGQNGRNYSSHDFRSVAKPNIATTSRYQFAGFPPICITRSPNVLFYAAVSLIAIFGVCLLVGALWPLRALCIAI